MLSFVIAIIIIQGILLTGTLIIGGVLKQGEENAYQGFSEKVDNRKNYIQREMKDRWTNMSPFIQEISKELTKYGDLDDFFSSSIEDMIDMLRTTQTTGVFMILDDDSSSYPALYLRDYDPLLNDYSNKDLYLLLGPPDLAKEYKIPLDQSWKYKMNFENSDNNFYNKPFINAPLTFNAGLLGYWNTPFKLFPDDISIITYTLPLFDSDNVLKGVIGVELSVNYINQFLPATDLAPKDSMGYMLGYSDSGIDDIELILTIGALQERMINDSEKLKLTEVDISRNIFKLENHNSAEEIYANVQEIGIYNYNTPFESEKWYLIGMMTESHLLNYVRKIQNLLITSIIASLVISMAVGYIVIYRLTKPITKLAKEVKENDVDKAIHFSETGLKEIDELSIAMESANNAFLESTVKMSQIIDLTNFPMSAFEIRNSSKKVLVTDQFHQLMNIGLDKVEELTKDKRKFIRYLDSIITNPEQDEDDVYSLDSQNKYIRIKVVEYDFGIMGVVVDVTKEIIEKNRIKKELDFDPLTMIYNRKATQDRIEKVLDNIDLRETAALIMFDLDNLKKINDTYGHKWGDFYIKKAVSHLTKIGINSSILGRRSGDEFILILYGYENKESIRREMVSLYDELSKELLECPDGSSKPITISSGLLWIEDITLGYDELLHKADSLLYKAKNHNKGNFVESGEV